MKKKQRTKALETKKVNKLIKKKCYKFVELVKKNLPKPVKNLKLRLFHQTISFEHDTYIFILNLIKQNNYGINMSAFGINSFEDLIEYIIEDIKDKMNDKNIYYGSEYVQIMPYQYVLDYKNDLKKNMGPSYNEEVTIGSFVNDDMIVNDIIYKAAKQAFEKLKNN